MRGRLFLVSLIIHRKDIHNHKRTGNIRKPRAEYISPVRIAKTTEKQTCRDNKEDRDPETNNTTKAKAIIPMLVAPTTMPIIGITQKRTLIALILTIKLSLKNYSTLRSNKVHPKIL